MSRQEAVLQSPDRKGTGMELIIANPGEPDNPMVLKIIEAQKELAAKDPFCVYVDTSGAGLANTAHFDAAGTLEIGRRYAEAILKHEKK